MNPAPDPCITLSVGMKGRYRCVLNEGTARESSTGWFDNLVTDGGLDRLGTASDSSIFANLSVGTGSAAPANGDASLGAFVAATSNRTAMTQSNPGAPSYKAQFNATYAFAVGAVVGNIAEVGLGWKSDGSGLWSRALIVDVNGVPTPINVTAIDQLTIYYQLTCAPNIADLAGTVSISGQAYSYVGRIANATTFASSLFTMLSTLMPPSGIGTPSVYPAASTLGTITGNPSGTASVVGTAAAAAYTPGSRCLDTVLTFLPAVANLAGGIGCIRTSYCGGAMLFQYKFTPAIPKVATMTLTLTVRFAWDRG